MDARDRNLAVFISGGGRTLLNIHDAIEYSRLDAKIVLVVASRECAGAQRARDRGLPVIVRPGDIPEDELALMMQESGARWIVLAGYLRLVPILPEFQNRVVNIHPALLPEFGGPGMFGDRVHREVLRTDAKKTGCTVHLCDGLYDTGPILAQSCCDVREDDTIESLAARVFELETELYPRVLRDLLDGRYHIDGNHAVLKDSTQRG